MIGRANWNPLAKSLPICKCISEQPEVSAGSINPAAQRGTRTKSRAGGFQGHSCLLKAPRIQPKRGNPGLETATYRTGRHLFNGDETGHNWLDDSKSPDVFKADTEAGAAPRADPCQKAEQERCKNAVFFGKPSMFR